MNDNKQTQYEKLREIVETLDAKIEEIRKINEKDIATFSEEELHELKEQMKDE